MSFSDMSEADPKSHNFRTVFCSLTCIEIHQKDTINENTLTYQDIIGLDVCVHNIRLLEQTQRQKELVSVRPNGTDI